MKDRAALLAAMREPFCEKARQHMVLYREFGGVASDEALEDAINMLWLHSVTDGSASYQAYLVSPLWKTISRDTLLRDGHLCAACRREAEVVHHMRYDYEVMAGLDDSGLISLCGPCHHYIHFDRSEKTLLSTWKNRFKDLQKSFVKKRKSHHFA